MDASSAGSFEFGMSGISNGTVYVQPTTGGLIQMSLPLQTSVNSLKLVLAKKLKVPKDKIVLLHRNRQLTEGSLQENNVLDGSKLILLPTVETGLVTPSAEQCVMQALETLNESQVEDFLAGRSPLNLSMRMGDHMMFVQLQLSPPADGQADPPLPPTPPPSPPSFRQATRSLAHTLKGLTSRTLQDKMNENCDGRCCIARQQGGAVIESMFNHGRGVFSGTFTGTLNPLLQDPEGRPKRHIWTILHILNDVLCASSHCNSPPCTPPAGDATTFLDKGSECSAAGETADDSDSLRQKVQRIRSLLRERRIQRRPAPYHAPSSPDTPTPDYSSGTAVA